MSVQDQIRSKLERAFAPVELNIIDESADHAGHVGAREEGETHFRVEIVSAAFTGKNRLQRQRDIYASLKEELEGPVHALSIQARSPDDA